MPIKNWPVADRPREKICRLGGYPMSEAELLAIVIGKGVRGKSALDLARLLVSRTGNLRRLSECGARDIEKMKIPGLGKAKIAAILAAIELGRRVLAGRDEPHVLLNSPAAVYNYYGPMVQGLKRELFKVVAVDGRNRMISDTTISKGILDASLVHPREVFRFALDENAHGIFLVHNHPSAILKPSDDDLRVTERLRQAGELMGIRVIDHVIVTGNGYYSFSEHNLL